MLKTLIRILTPADIETSEERQTALILNITLLVCLAVLLFRAVSFAFIDRVDRIDLYAVPILTAAVLISFYFSKKGYITIMSYLLVCGLWIRATVRFFGFDATFSGSMHLIIYK